jgi:hypothetical protein
MIDSAEDKQAAASSAFLIGLRRFIKQGFIWAKIKRVGEF